MSLLYVVRSRFTGTASAEAEWNSWYMGHLDVLMGVSGFLAAQRFKTDSSPDQRPYLALYEVQGADVFTSPDYLKIWGFHSWRDQIDNWTRDLFELGRGPDLRFATELGSSLRAAFLSPAGLPAKQSKAWLAALPDRARGGIVYGLDRSCAAIAWLIGPAEQLGESLPGQDGADTVQALYSPLNSCLTK